MMRLPARLSRGDDASKPWVYVKESGKMYAQTVSSDMKLHFVVNSSLDVNDAQGAEVGKTNPSPTVSLSTDSGDITDRVAILYTLDLATKSGCTDPGADNYDDRAGNDDGSCVTSGCTNSDADNYDAAANNDDGSCIISGCTNSGADNYDASANNDDGSCEISGCTDPGADNYDAAANKDDGSCVTVVDGCTDSTALNYNAAANNDDGSCVAVVNGCMDSTAFNYDATANTDDGSCVDVVTGCTNPAAENYRSAANTDDGSCIISGCTDPDAGNYNADANTDDGSCLTGVVLTLTVTDSYGDGWNDGKLTISDITNGESNDYTLEDGSEKLVSLTLEPDRLYRITHDGNIGSFAEERGFSIKKEGQILVEMQAGVNNFDQYYIFDGSAFNAPTGYDTYSIDLKHDVTYNGTLNSIRKHGIQSSMRGAIISEMDNLLSISSEQFAYDMNITNTVTPDSTDASRDNPAAVTIYEDDGYLPYTIEFKYFGTLPDNFVSKLAAGNTLIEWTDNGKTFKTIVASFTFNMNGVETSVPKAVIHENGEYTYPLYYSADEIAGSSHEHQFNNVTYYMPDGGFMNDTTPPPTNYGIIDLRNVTEPISYTFDLVENIRENGEVRTNKIMKSFFEIDIMAKALAEVLPGVTNILYDYDSVNDMGKIDDNTQYVKYSITFKYPGELPLRFRANGAIAFTFADYGLLWSSRLESDATMMVDVDNNERLVLVKYTGSDDTVDDIGSALRGSTDFTDEYPGVNVISSKLDPARYAILDLPDDVAVGVNSNYLKKKNRTGFTSQPMQSEVRVMWRTHKDAASYSNTEFFEQFKDVDAIQLNEELLYTGFNLLNATQGCTDKNATNYSEYNVKEDGSCAYPQIEVSNENDNLVLVKYVGLTDDINVKDLLESSSDFQQLYIDDGVAIDVISAGNPLYAVMRLNEGKKVGINSGWFKKPNRTAWTNDPEINTGVEVLWRSVPGIGSFSNEVNLAPFNDSNVDVAAEMSVIGINLI